MFITVSDAINPPQHMAQRLGFPDDVIFSTVYYNGQPVMPFTLLLHFSFAIVFSILLILLSGAAGVAAWLIGRRKEGK